MHEVPFYGPCFVLKKNMKYWFFVLEKWNLWMLLRVYLKEKIYVSTVPQTRTEQRGTCWATVARSRMLPRGWCADLSPPFHVPRSARLEKRETREREIEKRDKPLFLPQLRGLPLKKKKNSGKAGSFSLVLDLCDGGSQALVKHPRRSSTGSKLPGLCQQQARRTSPPLPVAQPSELLPDPAFCTVRTIINHSRFARRKVETRAQELGSQMNSSEIRRISAIITAKFLVSSFPDCASICTSRSATGKAAASALDSSQRKALATWAFWVSNFNWNNSGNTGLGMMN